MENPKKPFQDRTEKIQDRTEKSPPFFQERTGNAKIPFQNHTAIRFTQRACPQQLPGYEIVAEIARGGMGVVYRGRQKNLKRDVAIKFLLQGAQDEEMVGRFLREASTAAKLNHPHIVSIHDVGISEGRYFFVMDFVKGRSIAQILEQEGRIAEPKALRWIIQIAGALDYAHSRNVIHRDIKPSNIMIDEQENALLTDFGLARDTTDDQRFTQTGQTLGTPAYMAPEQATGDEVDHTADIYALGTVLYEMLSGRPPFSGRSAAAILVQLVQEEPPRLSHLVPQLDRRLESICLKAMAKEPLQRYRTAGQMRADIERYQAGEPLLARSSNWERWRHSLYKKRLGLITAASALFVLVLLYALWLRPRWHFYQRQQAGQRWMQAGQQALQQNAAERARRCFTKALACDPRQIQILRTLFQTQSAQAYQYYQARQYPQALKIFQQLAPLLLLPALQVGPDTHSRFLLARGDCWEHCAQFSKAYQDYTLAWEVNRHNYRPMYYLARFWFWRACLPEASKAVKRYINSCRQDYQGYFLLGQILESQKLYRQALVCYRKAQQLQPDFAPSRRCYTFLSQLTAQLEAEKHLRREILEASKKIARHPRDIQAFCQRARAYMHMAQSKQRRAAYLWWHPAPVINCLSKAQQDLSRAARLNPEHCTLKLEQVRYALLIGDQTRAQLLLTQLKAPQEHTAQFYRLWGRWHEKQEQYEQALRDYQQALPSDPSEWLLRAITRARTLAAYQRQAPSDWRSLQKQAQYYEQNGIFNKACQCYAKALKMNLQPELLIAHARSWALQKGFTSIEVRHDLDRLLHNFPGHPQALYLRGQWFWQHRKYAQALRDWHPLLHHPDFADLPLCMKLAREGLRGKPHRHRGG